MKRDAPKWSSEAAMLAAFAAEARAMGFRVVPEACGHDMLLVAPEARLRRPRRHWNFIEIPDHLDAGDVIAVEGKLRASVTVLRQSLPPARRAHTSHANPCAAADFYALVVPDYDPDFLEIAQALDVCVWTMRPEPPAGEWQARSGLDRFVIPAGARVVGHPRLAVPDLDVNMPAGMPAPRKLTPWKIAAVRLCLLGMERDLTTADFAAQPPCTARSLVDRGWAELVGRQGRAGVYRLLDSPTRPDRAYPEIVAAIRAMPAPSAPPVAPAGALFGGAA